MWHGCQKITASRRIASDILYIIEKITRSKDVAIWISGEHACMTTRGIKNSSSKTITTTFRGRFLEDELLAQRVIGMYKD